MINETLYLKDGTQLATAYNRVVHGERGDYVELEPSQFDVELLSKFHNDIEKDSPGYYYWLYPTGHPDVKIYKQVRTVKYADYKVGKYYISPIFLRDFKDKEKLF